MRHFLLISLSLLLAIHTQASMYAIRYIDNQSKKEILDWCESHAYHSVILKNEGFILVEDPVLEEMNDFGFWSEVKQYENMLLFNTNTILVRTAMNSQLALPHAKVSEHPFIPSLFYVESDVKNENELHELYEQIKRLDAVELVEIKQVFTIQATTNDPLYERQWSIENTGSLLQSNGTPDADMDVDSAWTISEGSSNVKVAILDSGVDTLHEDLAANILPGFDGFATDTSDTKGYPTPNFSSDGHGTACAGIVAAVSNNNLGVAGIAPLCKIVPIRIFYYQDYGGTVGIQATTNTDALISGSAFAWRVADADVMSTSAGLSQLFIGVLGVNTQLVEDEINEAFINGRNGYGVPMFFSAGNDDISDVLWPADMDVTIAVGASSMCDERKNPNDCSPESWGSSYGLSLDVVAPGVRITTTDLTGGFGYSNNNYTPSFNGTSAACPNAAGVGALIVSFSPGLHARDIKAVLSITAERVGGYSYDSTGVHGTWNEEMGHGRVNAFEALKLAETYPTSVGIRDLALLNIGVYPNPSSGTIYIENPEANLLDLVIYDTLGKEVFRRKIAQGVQQIDLSLEPGIYWVGSSNRRGAKPLLIK